MTDIGTVLASVGGELFQCSWVVDDDRTGRLNRFDERGWSWQIRR